ncbi:MAG: hypothetical protein ACE5EE_08630 [Fidelibacterota bacterium]
MPILHYLSASRRIGITTDPPSLHYGGQARARPPDRCWFCRLRKSEDKRHSGAKEKDYSLFESRHLCRVSLNNPLSRAGTPHFFYSLPAIILEGLCAKENGERLLLKSLISDKSQYYLEMF